MTVTVTLNFATAAAAAAFLAGVPTPDAAPGKSAPADSPAASPPSATVAPTPAPTKPPKPAATPTAAPVTQSTESVDPLLGPYEKSGLGELIQALAKKDRNKAVELLLKHGGAKGPEVPVANRAALKADIEAALAPAEGGDLG